MYQTTARRRRALEAPATGDPAEPTPSAVIAAQSQVRSPDASGPGEAACGEPAPREHDERWMDEALAEARLAEAADEVPIGAVVVLEGRVVGRGHNRTRRDQDPTQHAEMVALRAAARELQAQRLVGATVYTTVEPCFMCAGALSHARVARVVWGVRDPKFGGCASLGNVLGDARLNHRAQVTEGVRADEARELLVTFFQSKRG